MTGFRITGLPLPPAVEGSLSPTAPNAANRIGELRAAGISQLTGFVEAGIGGGAVRIATEHGPIVVRLAAHLASGTPVVVTLHDDSRGGPAVSVQPVVHGNASPRLPLTEAGDLPPQRIPPLNHGHGLPAVETTSAGGQATPVTAGPRPPEPGSGLASATVPAAVARGGAVLGQGSAPVAAFGPPSPSPPSSPHPATPVILPVDHPVAPLPARLVAAVVVPDPESPPPTGTPSPPTLRLSPAIASTFARTFEALLAAAVAAPPRPPTGRTTSAAATPPARDLAAFLLVLVAATRGSEASPARPAVRPASISGSAPAAEAGEDGETWQMLVLPGVDGLSLPLVVYERHRPGEDAGKRPAASKTAGAGDDGVSRFVFDCRFGALGRLQLDTLFRRPHHLDVIIRSEKPLPPGVADAIRATFAGATLPAGLTGGLAFQAAPAAWVEPNSAGRGEARLHLTV